MSIGILTVYFGCTFQLKTFFLISEGGARMGERDGRRGGEKGGRERERE